MLSLNHLHYKPPETPMISWNSTKTRCHAPRGRKAQKVFPHWSKSEKRSFCLVTNVNMNNSNLLLYFPKLQFLCMFHATIKYQDIWELLHFSSLNLWERVWVASFSVRIGLNALKSHIKENHVQNWQKIAMGHNKAWEEELLNKTKRLINAHKRNLTIKWGYDSFHMMITFRPWNLIRRFLNKIWR